MGSADRRSSSAAENEGARRGSRLHWRGLDVITICADPPRAIQSDTSGAGKLVTDVLHCKNVQFLGDTLRHIRAPGTAEQLLALFRQAPKESRQRVLSVIGLQKDPVYLDFLGGLLGDTDHRVVETAARAISGIVHAAPNVAHPPTVWLDREDLAVIRPLLLWAFRDKRIRPEDLEFPGHSSVGKQKGAVLKVNRYQWLAFTVETDRLALVDTKRGETPVSPDGSRLSRQGPYYRGSVKWSEEGDYLVVWLDVGSGGVGYLFRKGGDTPNAWEPAFCLSAEMR